MGKKPTIVVFIVLLMLNTSIGKHGRIMRQGDAIDKLYRDAFAKKIVMRDEVQQPPADYTIPDPYQYQNPATVPGPSQDQWQNGESSKEKDRIQKLPGQPNVSFQQYGGYITVDPNAGRALFYYFVESGLPQASSLFLWLNGGPGCSSLGYGAMHEIGPFRVLSDGKTLYKNKFRWNKAANILFLETPARVGFSYSNRTSDYATFSDGATAADNYMFLVRWLERFPEYKNREFYIGGESYAGHYVPQLANLIVQHNSMPNSPFINLKGILIGNPALNLESDVEGMFDYFAGHGLCSIDNINDVKRFCKFTAVRNDTMPCYNAIYKTYINTDDIDIYSILTPKCKSEAQAAYNENKTASVEVVDPCSSFYVYTYINRADVQEALHANTTKLLHYLWEPCNDLVLSTWADRYESILPILQNLKSKGLRLWLFSGDLDAKIPLTATQYSLKRMNVTTTKEWYPWFSNGEVGGYTEEYDGNITFATVRGAGHEVPYYQPERSLTLFRSFIAGTSLPPKFPSPKPIN